MNNIRKTLIAAIAAGLTVTAGAQHPGANPGVDLDSRTLSVQAKAEELFERGDYRRAHVIYLNDLAPIGDKYAQYMLGYMSLGGLGVEKDPVLASAWYRLAAERGEPHEFVAIRDELLDQFDEADRARSDRVYHRLRREYSDIVISMREAREEFDRLTQASTGSRIGSPSSAVTIVEPRAGNSLWGDALVYRNLRRLQAHLDHIAAELGTDRVDAQTVTAADLAELEKRVSAYLEQTGRR